MSEPCTREAARAWGEAHCATYAAPAVVMRHSGRADGWWRPVMTGTPESCGKDYEARRRRLRQGGVALYVRPRSDLPAELLLETAPRLRTRW